MRKFKVKIFADGADKAGMIEMYSHPLISGFTTNPTLMKKSGITNYEGFAREILSVITDKPISFEVFSDDFEEMYRQAITIAKWGTNVYVKIPITNTRNESSIPLIARLSKEGIKLNVTAMMTVDQAKKTLPALSGSPSSYISIFAGRVADTGVDPLPIMRQVVALLKNYPKIELIWASPRELLNIVQADDIGCHIITVTNDLLKKTVALGKSLDTFSLETVKMFYEDAKAAGFKIDC